MTMSLQATQLFETPLIIDEVPDAANLNIALKAAILARREANPEGMNNSNQRGWHSDRRMIEWGGAAVITLFERIVSLADCYTEDIAARSQPRYAWAPEIWANISGYGASNQYHCHAGAFWAAVYYVDDAYQGSAERALGGELELEDPRMPMMLMDGPDLRCRLPGVAVSSPEILLRPAAGRLLLFPAWLRHGVRPYLGHGERISIATNLTAVPVVI